MATTPPRLRSAWKAASRHLAVPGSLTVDTAKEPRNPGKESVQVSGHDALDLKSRLGEVEDQTMVLSGGRRYERTNTKWVSVIPFAALSSTTTLPPDRRSSLCNPTSTPR